MRKPIRSLLHGGQHTFTGDPNVGLVLERCGLESDADLAEGKIKDVEQRSEFIDRLCAVGVSRLYPAAYATWRESLVDAWTCQVKCEGRLVIGHGNPSPFEVGLTLSHTYGTPLLPGSAQKGVLNHYIDQWGGAADERWRGVRYDEAGRPAEAPGAFHGTLFGAPDLADGQTGDAREGARGAAVFLDAWYVPGSAENDKPLVRDVLTPHLAADPASYYRNYGKHGGGPNDWEEPNPVSFCCVAPGTRFLLAVAGEANATEIAIRHLLDALERVGIGAKTAAGYGRLRRQGEPVRPKPASGPVSAALQKLIDTVAWVLAPADTADKDIPIVDRFERCFGNDAVISELPSGDRARAVEVVHGLRQARKLKRKCDARIDALQARLKE